MKKKLLAMLLVVCMSVGLLAGCGSSENTDTKSSEDSKENETDAETVVKVDNLEESREITIWMYKDDYKYYDSYANNPVVSYLNNKFNCTLNYQQPAMGSEQEQFSLMLGTGSYTDIMEISYSSEGVTSLYEDGVIRDLAPYLADYAPDLYQWLQETENEDVRDALYDSEGHLFTIPMNVNTSDTLLWGGMVYRRDIIETMTGGYVAFPSGNEEPTTVEDWEYMLELFSQYFTAAALVDSAGLILPYNGYFSTGELLNGFGACSNFYIAEDGIVKYGPTEIEFYNYLVKMHEWYEKGYIYKDFASRTNDVFYLPNTALTYGGAAGIWFGLNSQIGDAMSMPEYGLEMNVLPTAAPLDSENGVEKGLSYLSLYPGRATMNSSGFVVSTSCDEEKLIRWLNICNYLFTDEGGMLKTYGLTVEQDADEDAIYQKGGVIGGAYTFNGADLIYHEKLVPSVGEIAVAGDGMSFVGSRLPGLSINEYENANAVEATVNASAIWRTYGNEQNYPNAISFSASDNDTVSNNYSNYADYLDSMVPKFIMGTEELSAEKWEKFVTEMNALGVTDNTVTYQNYYDEFASK